MTYVDGFVFAVPTADRENYRRFAQAVAAVFKEHGALQVVQCWGDDVPEGKLTSFTLAVQRRSDETVVFAWVSWPSKALRDEVHKKMPQLEKNPIPFDAKRMIYGGFEVIVNG